jgi:hypothetical protein
VNGLEYEYGGQWFNDMGGLTLAFMDAPIMGMSLARSGVSRAQANDMAKNLIRANVSPYDDGNSMVEVSDLSMES